MGKPVTLSIITRDDVIRSGACASGVDAWLLRCRPVPTAMTVADALRRCRDDGERAYVISAANLDGDGYGDGHGDGHGDGDGDGDGHGDGYGYGYGYGYGDGDGDGFGHGDE